MSAAPSTADVRLLFDYLRTEDSLPVEMADAVIGFGHFDLRIPRRCGELFAAGRARWIIFTGGIGAGTADLGQPEAEAFREELARTFPAIPPERQIIENRSTNTEENIRFTSDLLARAHPDLALGQGMRSAIVVASPSRLRRVRLTWTKLLPSVRTVAVAPVSDCETEAAIYSAKGLSFVAQLTGEIDRLLDYPRRGWIVGEPVPSAVLAAHARLKAVAH